MQEGKVKDIDFLWGGVKGWSLGDGVRGSKSFAGQFWGFRGTQAFHLQVVIPLFGGLLAPKQVYDRLGYHSAKDLPFGFLASVVLKPSIFVLWYHLPETF